MADFDFAGLRAYLTNQDLQVVIASRDVPAEPWRAHRLGARGGLQGSLRQLVLRSVNRLASRREEEYVEGWTPDPHTYAVVSSADTVGPLRDVLLGAYSAHVEHDERAGRVPEEGADTRSLRGRALGLVGRANDHVLLVIRAQNPVIEMSPDRVTAIIRGTQLSEARHLFTYDGRIDVLLWDQHAIIVASNVFEDLMRDPEQLRRELSAAVASFDASGLYTGLDRLAATASADSNFARGIRRIHKSGHLASVAFDAVRDQIENWGHDTITLTGDRKIEFDPTARWDFLRLLDDGYLTSDLTGFRYEVNSKRRWNRVEVKAVTRDAEGAIALLHGVGAWSPRSASDVVDDIDRGRSEYVIRHNERLLKCRVARLPNAAVPWAGPAGSPHNLLLDLPAPD